MKSYILRVSSSLLMGMKTFCL